MVCCRRGRHLPGDVPGQRELIGHCGADAVTDEQISLAKVVGALQDANGGEDVVDVVGVSGGAELVARRL